MMYATAAVLVTMCAVPIVAQPVRVVYRDVANSFEILDQVSDWWPGYVDPAYRRFWADSVGFGPGDSAIFARYAQLRAKHVNQSGQSSSAPRIDGSGLFTDRAVLSADPVATAFYAAESVDSALTALRTILTPAELAFLRTFYRRFATRVAPLLEATRTRTSASRAATAATLSTPKVDAYLVRARQWLGSEPTAFTALYVWWPDSARLSASPMGQHLLLRVRPTAGDTIDSADLVAHEAMHVFAAGMDSVRQRTISTALMNGCPVPAGVKRLAVLEEPIATALGNIEFRRRFAPRRFQWGRRWYGDDWVDLYARLLYPLVMASLSGDEPIDAPFGREAAALCAVAARARTPRAP